MAQTKSKSSRTAAVKSRKARSDSSAKRIFPRDPGAAARREARKQAAKKR